MAKFMVASALWRTLGIANFRNYTAGNFVSQFGMWTQRIAIQWLTWELTHSPTWLGIVAFADFFPNILMAPLAGALADRVEQLSAIRRYMWISGAISFALAGLVLTGTITIGLLLALVIVNGSIMAFNFPVRLSIIHALVDRDDLTSAISINALTFNIARIGGPALAGLIISLWGVGPAFAFTAVSNVAFVCALYVVRLKGNAERRERKPAREIPAEILEGYRYARRHPGIGPLLLILVTTTVFARPYNDLFAGFADDVFGRGADGLAMLTATLGAGAFIGSLFLARRRGIEGLTRLLVGAVLLFAVALTGFTATDIFWVALLCTGFAGLSTVTVGVAEQTLIQSSVDSAMRGRILSMYTLIARGFPSIGALIMGTIASHVGLRLPVFGGAMVCLAVWAWARSRQARMAAALEVPRKSG